MKKILSIILTILMIITTMPMAFAVIPDEALWGTADNLSQSGTLKEALEAADKNKEITYIKLNTDVVLTEELTVIYGSFTLDINGKNLSLDGSVNDSIWNSPIDVCSGKNIIFEDTAENKGTISSPGVAVSVGYGSAEFKNINLVGGSYGVAVSSGSYAEFDGANIKGNTYGGIISDGEVNLISGTVSGEGYGIRLTMADSKLKVSGGEIDGKLYDISFVNGTVDFSDYKEEEDISLYVEDGELVTLSDIVVEDGYYITDENHNSVDAFESEKTYLITKHAHSFENGKCSCGYECPHESYVNGICEICGTAEPVVPLTIDITDKNYIDIGEGHNYYDKDGYIITGRNAEAYIEVCESADLTFRDAEFKQFVVQYAPDDTVVNITLEGTNEINGYIVLGLQHLVFDGSDDATLKLPYLTTGGRKGTVTVNGGKINAATETTSNIPTIGCGGGFTLNGGEVTASNNYYYVADAPVTLNGGVLNIISTSQDCEAINCKITMKKGALLTISTESEMLSDWYNTGIVPADDSDENESLFVRYDKTSDCVPVHDIEAALDGKTYAQIKVDTHDHYFESSGKCICGCECPHEGLDDDRCDICGHFFYKITHQPTSDEPYVELNNDTGASYQWHLVEKEYVELTDENTLAETYNGYETSYSEDEGWGGYLVTDEDEDEDEEYVGYFMVELKEGDTLEIESSEAVTDGCFGIWDYEEETGVYDYFTGTEFELTAPADGTYEFYSYYVDENVKFRVHKNGAPTFKAIESETSSELSNSVIGKTYVCKVTCGDGETVLTTESIKKPYKITHQPTAAEPYVELNDSEKVAYQWFVQSGFTETPITDENAEPYDNYYKSYYDSDSGWFGCDSGSHTGVAYFIVPLRKGDKVTVNIANHSWEKFGFYDIGPSNNSVEVDYVEGVTTYSFEIKKDASYVFEAWATGLLNGHTGCPLTATISRANFIPIEGETSAELQNPVIGNIYACRATCGDAADVLTTKAFEYVYAISHQPTTEETYVEFNEDAEATYQWYKLGGDVREITDENASGNWKSIDDSLTNSVYKDGKWVGCPYEDMQFYFMVDMKAGEKLSVELSEPVDGVGLSFGGDTPDFVAPQEPTKASFIAEEDGNYWFITLGTIDYISAYIGDVEYIPVEGATSAAFNPTEPGRYICKVTFCDGTTELSDAFEVTHICDFSGEWKFNSDKHWKECKCGKIGEEGGHNYSAVLSAPASLTADGKTEYKCTCGHIKKTETIAKIKSLTLSTTKYIYNGKNKTPKLTVKDADGKVLTKNVDYKITVASNRAGIGRYTVKVNFMGKYSGSKNVFFYILPGKSASVKSASQSTSAIKLSWSAVPGAAGYTVYRYSPSKKAYVKAGATEGTTLTVNNLLTGTKYTFRVVAYGKTAAGKVYDSETYALLRSATKTKTPELTKVTASSTKGKAYVYHTDVKGETGYTVYYSTSKTTGFKKYANFKADTTRCDITGLTSGKTYYFKVRTYIKTDSGYVYSPWSAVKGIKVK